MEFRTTVVYIELYERVYVYEYKCGSNQFGRNTFEIRNNGRLS